MIDKYINNWYIMEYTIKQAGDGIVTLGKKGESLAEQFLLQKSYRIIERNFRCRLGEIDLIAMDEAVLVFIEVKTRRNQNYGLPCEAVNAAKITHLKRVAAYYMSCHGMGSMNARLDVIEILINNDRPFFHHIENITG